MLSSRSLLAIYFIYSSMYMSIPISSSTFVYGSVCCMLSSALCDSATLWTVSHQALQSMGFSRQEYWSGLPRPPPGDLPDPGIEPVSVTSLALADEFFTTSATWEALQHYVVWLFTMPRNDIWSVLPIVHSAFSY